MPVLRRALAERDPRPVGAGVGGVHLLPLLVVVTVGGGGDRDGRRRDVLDLEGADVAGGGPWGRDPSLVGLGGFSRFARVVPPAPGWGGHRRRGPPVFSGGPR